MAGDPTGGGPILKPMFGLSRPRLSRLPLIAAAVAAVGLSACSAGTPTGPAASSTPSSPPATSPSAAPETPEPSPSPSAITPSAPAPAPAETTTPPAPRSSPAAEDVNGHWCPSKESNDNHGCVTVTLPTVTWATSGVKDTISLLEARDGGFYLITTGAPFGLYLPAGVPIDLPDYYAGGDLPDVDRIWNGQTGVLYLRQP